MSLNISLASAPDERDAVFRLRYTLLVEEARQSPPLADHHLRFIEEPADATARFVIASFDETIVGALRVNLLGEGDPANDAALFRIERFSEAHAHTIAFTAPPLIASGFRTSTVPLRLALAAFSMNLDEGITHDFTLCTPDQESYCKDLGYQPYCGRLRHAERGDVLPLVLVLRDRAHLEKVHSPLAARLREKQQEWSSRLGAH